MLPDLLRNDLKLVVCGTAVGTNSANLGHYYADPRNLFWKTLADVGLTPDRLGPERDKDLLDFGIGLTDLAKLTAGSDTSLSECDFDLEGFSRKIQKYSPSIVCFNGKEAARTFLGERKIEYGWRPDPIESAKVFVAPSTSGAARAYYDITYWQELAERCRATDE